MAGPPGICAERAIRGMKSGPSDKQTRVSRLIYPYRVVGMAVGGLAVSSVLYRLNPVWPVWAFVVLGCLGWPHVAYWRALRHADPIQAERHNLLIDSVIAGAMLPLMHFNLLPSMLLVTLSTVDKLSSGFRRLWLLSLPALVLGAVASAVVFGTGVSLETPMPVLLACLPMLLIHTMAVSVGRYQLIRKVTVQNRELDRLRRIDTLTGLSRRGDWEEKAEQVLADQHMSRHDCILLIDVDRFKQINDEHGHQAGDATLRELAKRMRRVMRPRDHIGRRGGDEFAVLLPDTTEAEAFVIAERLRREVEQIRLLDYPDVTPTVSIGLAVAPRTPTHLDSWLEQADNALYRAKHQGRNVVMA